MCVESFLHEQSRGATHAQLSASEVNKTRKPGYNVERKSFKIGLFPVIYLFLSKSLHLYL